ncbi:MAG: peptidylprolyl isomerase [Lachnospiraceae bacterium]|nr:peptidylprolyl isomerase [Lachnospiraceae bacterium]
MSENVLAVVAGKELTEAQFEAYLKSVPREQQMYAQNPQYREQYKEQFIDLYLFAQLGQDEKMDETAEFKEIMEGARRDILAQLAMRDMLKDITVTEEEEKAFYEENKAQFGKGATVNAKHILTDSEEKCQTILKNIESGEKTFEDAAKEFSTCPSGAQGGSLGEFGKGQMVKEFEDAAFDAEIGKVVGPVKTQFGYHLIKVEAKNEAKTAEFEEVKGQIRQQLLGMKQNEAYEAKVKELKENYLK